MIRQKLVVLTGAGISAESGLKTFRDSDGLWEGYAVAEVATPEAWKKDPKRVLRFYNERRKKVLEAVPNAAHEALAALEKDFDVIIITQNIDDLHERAGSSRVIHLHGEILKMRSEYQEDRIVEVRGDIYWGDLAEDGFQLRPHIVWFGEPVPMMDTAVYWVQQAQYFVVVGTSLAVYPAAGLLQYAPPDIPRYIIDKKIPAIAAPGQWMAIEKPATAGMQDLVKMLRER